jgi:riboflavin kinase / FMN adenylyltransferase
MPATPMQVHHELPRQPMAADCALTIGTFDGVHRGHAMLIETLRREAAQRRLPPAVLTFRDMPYYYFDAVGCPRLLTMPAEKTAAFRSLNIRDLYLVPFDGGLAEQSAETFVRDVVVRDLRTKLLVLGPDFALGKGRAGDIPMLRSLGERCGFEVVVIGGKLADGGAAISSTRIRECVESGDVTAAARLLDRPFSLMGTVVTGRQLGRTIGVPTINLRAHPRKVLPASGVYAARAFFDDFDGAAGDAIADATASRLASVSCPAALNIGTRPTVDGSDLSIEFHVISEDISEPPRAARLEIIERLREERKFSDLSTLTAQMRRDIAQAAVILAS